MTGQVSNVWVKSLIVCTITIRYMISASIVGFYSAPLLRRLTPARHNTPMIIVRESSNGVCTCSILSGKFVIGGEQIDHPSLSKE